MKLDELTAQILSAAHAVHLGVGPGLHRAEYGKCLFSKACSIRRGLLINFNVADLQEGIVCIENQQNE